MTANKLYIRTEPSSKLKPSFYCKTYGTKTKQEKNKSTDTQAPRGLLKAPKVGDRQWTTFFLPRWGAGGSVWLSRLGHRACHAFWFNSQGLPE